MSDRYLWREGDIRARSEEEQVRSQERSEREAEARRRDFAHRVDAEHRKRFRCAECDRPLGFAEAYGVDTALLHLGCVERYKQRPESA